MKRINVLLPFIALIFIFNSCKKEEDFSIVGTWQQEKSEMIINFGIPGVEPQTFPNNDPYTFVFSSDKTGVLITDETTEEFTWTLSGKNLTVVQENQTLVMNLTTMTDTRLVGEQTLTSTQLLLIPGYEDYQDALAMFPNLTAQIVVHLVRDPS